MDNQDKLYEQFQQAAQKSETRDFEAMEKVWARVEEKLDKKKDRKAIVLWQKLAVAASLLLFLTLGYQFFNNNPDPKILQQVVRTPASDNPKTDTVKTEAVAIEDNSKEADLDKDHVEKVLWEKQSEQGIVSNEKTSRKSDSIQYGLSTKKALVWKKRTAQQDLNFVAEINKNEVQKEAQPSHSENKIEVNEAILSENNLQTKDTEIAVAQVATHPVTGEKTITGTVTDQQMPLPGVSVVIKGTTTGTQTDFDGKFSIKVIPGDQLVFSYIGFQSDIVTVGKRDNISVALQEADQILHGVTVVSEGYNRTKTKTEKRTAQKKISSETKENRANQSVLATLQGQSPGLSLTSSSGAPGSAKFDGYIRGANSIKGNTDPLLVINGVPATSDQFRNLNPDDIASVTVLRDSTGTSIYGNKGANGVILIKTKSGKIKKLSKKERRQKMLKERKRVLELQKQQQIEVSQEDYESFEENPFESPKNKPLSTFSIDVDNASYTNVRRFINNGQTVPKDAVRVEEMVNFFKYEYPQPTNHQPFSINTEYSEAPWNPKHKILRIGLQGKIIPTTELPASNLVFLIDVSGSMNDANKLPLLKQSMKILVEELRKKDKVSIVVYAGAAGLVLPPTSGDEKQTIINALEQLSAGGSTAGGAGIDLAYKIAEDHFIKNGNNRVILATDGDFNVGGSSNSDMQTLIEEKRKTGVFLTCLGYGMGNYKDSKMEILSDKGNGNYAYIDNIQEANRFLGKEFKGSMFAIAKDVKIQIEFNPKHVQSYRLIGYENRKLRDEDFVNDKIDAGELGSGHTVTALYEVIPTGVDSDLFANPTDLKYTKVESSENSYNDELATIKFRHKKPDGDTSIETTQVIDNKSVILKNASADFKFSTAVAWFGLKLRDSKLVPNKETEAIKKLAKEGIENDPDGYKAEFIRLVETVK